MRLLEKIFKSWWFLPFLGGLIVRLILMPITLHPDLWGHSFSAYFLAYEGKFNLYDTLVSLPQDHPLVRNFGVSDIFIYPPLAYYTLGFFRILVKPFIDSNFIPWLWENLDKVYSYPYLFKNLFLFKAPYLFIDFALAFFLSRLFGDLNKKKIAFSLWMFNPLALYATFMIGQLDLLPTFFTLLALYFSARKKPELAMISLGMGGSYKMFPLLLIPPAAFVFACDLKKRIKFLILGFLPFLFFIFPFLSSSAFRSMVLFSPKSQKMLFMGWPLSGAEVIYPFILILVFIYLFSFFSEKKYFLNSYFLSILLLVFSVTHFHPQWFLWVTPFLIYELVENNFRHSALVFILFGCWLVLTLLFEPSLSFGLFNPLWPHLEKALGLAEVLSRYTNVFQFKSLVRSVFAGTSLFWVFRLFF